MKDGVALSSTSSHYWGKSLSLGLYDASYINADAVLSSVVGQLLFGYLADRYGRTRLYGIELVLVIVSTIGVATSSNGYGNMSFLAIFTWVRLSTR
jgi:PHS family inorganic phosphate transporter-like MFS transporter